MKILFFNIWFKYFKTEDRSLNLVVCCFFFTIYFNEPLKVATQIFSIFLIPVPV